VAPTIDDICTLLVQSGLMPDGDAQTVRRRWLREVGAAAADVTRFGRWLVANKYVTDYQADRLLRGKSDYFFFNEYKLLDRIGHGRMAGVYKAMHCLGQVVAIKVLPPSKAKDPKALARFQREARLALRLKHPNVVRTFQTGLADQMHYLVMEYLDGETLEEVMQRHKRLPTDEAVRLIRQALQGLQHLHEQGMVHRDLKPANLMLVPAGATGEPDNTMRATLKILDIGVGRALFDEGDATSAEQPDKLTNRGDLLGSPDYMAPEQARDAHTADIRADIYSLGCVLYHALTGQPPFPDANSVQKLKKHALAMPEPLKVFNPAADRLQGIINKMLAKDPAQRYATPAQAAQALQTFLAREPQPVLVAKAVRADRKKLEDYERWLAATHPESPGANLLQRHPKKVLAAAGAGLAGVLLIVGLLFALHRPKQETKVADQQPPDKGSSASPPAPPETFEAWRERVAKLPAEAQVDEVATKMKELNNGFDGVITPTIEEGVVTGLQFLTDDVTDLSPLQALRGLKLLSCTGSPPNGGKVRDLSALKGLKLVSLDCGYNEEVSNLSPSEDMPLISLGIAGTRVANLSPLRNLSLMSVNCAGTKVTNLSALKDTGLRMLDITETTVEDLSPLRGMPLQYLRVRVRHRHEELVLSLKLTEINGQPMTQFRADIAARRKEDADQQAYQKKITRKKPEEQVKEIADKLKSLNPGFDPKSVTPTIENGLVTGLQFPADNVTDISPVQALPKLKRLSCKGSAPGKTKLESLQPLQSMPLIELDIDFKPSRDLAILGSMKTLETINGRPAAKFLADAKRQVELDQRSSKGHGASAGKEKPGPTNRFVGTLLSHLRNAPRTADGERILTVRTSEAILLPSAYHAKKLVKHRLQYLEALREPNPVRRIERLQDAQHEIAKHQALLYTPVEANRTIDVLVDTNTKIRRKTLPPAVDENYKPRKYTSQEEDRMRGPDKRLPGYETDVSALAKDQPVEVYVTPAVPAKPADDGTEPSGKPRSRVKMIVLLP
jgi:serine/threonine protein kinase